MGDDWQDTDERTGSPSFTGKSDPVMLAVERIIRVIPTLQDFPNKKALVNDLAEIISAELDYDRLKRLEERGRELAFHVRIKSDALVLESLACEYLRVAEGKEDA